MSVIAQAVAVVVLLSAFTNTATAATQAQIDQARAKGLAWLIMNQNGDGSWQAAPGLGVQSTAAALDALTNAGIFRGHSFGTAVTWLKNADAPSVDSLSRKANALKGASGDVTAYLDQLLSWRSDPFPIQNGAKWGAYNQYPMSFPDTPLALSAIRLAQYTYSGQSLDLQYGVYCQILPSQLPDGSWPFMAISADTPTLNTPTTVLTGAILPTAYTTIELQAIKAANSSWGSAGCYATSYDLQTGINHGRDYILRKKNPDGGFGDNGQSSPLETALAYQVLNAVNSTDPAMGAALDYLVNQQDGAGSWQGDPFQTALVLKAFPPTAMTDSDQDGIPDAVEAILGTNPLVADGHGIVKGNGQGVSGITVPTLLASAMFNVSFTTSLTAGGGTPPYGWGVVSGSLPDGLMFNGATGAISGTPVRA